MTYLMIIEEPEEGLKKTKRIEASCIEDAELIIKGQFPSWHIVNIKEDNMFDDFPKLSNQHIDVFYGAPDVTTTDVDKEQTALMRKLVKELFKDNWE
jgi:DNA polymerase III alpha subunit (gram-positive type)